MFLESKIELDTDENELIKFVLGDCFPWYLFNQLEHTEKYKVFCHSLMKREGNNLPTRGIQNSNLLEPFENIFNKFCQKNNIQVNNVLRMAFNNTWHCDDKHSDIHTDHDFPHHNFLWYLNDFTEGSTYIFEDDKKTIKHEIKAEKNKIAIFEGNPHAQGFCSPYQNRVVFVATFN